MKTNLDLFEPPKSATVDFNNWTTFLESLPARGLRPSTIEHHNGSYIVELVTREPNYPIPISKNPLTLTQTVDNPHIPATESHEIEAGSELGEI